MLIEGFFAKYILNLSPLGDVAGFVSYASLIPMSMIMMLTFVEELTLDAIFR